MSKAKKFQDLKEYEQLVEKSAASSDGTRSDKAAVDAALKSLDEDGFVIVENLLPLPLLETLRNEVHELLGPMGRSSFEGFQTQRIYGVLARTLSCNPLIEHPLATRRF